MVRVSIACLLVALLSSALPASAQNVAQVQVVNGAPPPVMVAPPPVMAAPSPVMAAPPPSCIFCHMILTGAFTGLAGGYLAFRRDAGGWGDNWRALGLGTLGGVIAGAGLGLTLLVVDGPYGGRRYVTRDFVGGAGFGALIGLAAGGISAIRSGDGEHAVLGAAIGALSGAGIGLIAGILEASLRRPRLRVAQRPRRVRAELVSFTDAHARHVFGPGLRGSF